MGSINDYGRRKRIPTEGGGWRGGTGSSWKRRLLIQCAASIVLFLVVAAGINADNFLGRSARYIAVSGVSLENSWLWSQDDPNVTPVTSQPGDTGTTGATIPGVKDPTTGDPSTSDPATGDPTTGADATEDSDTLPQFTAPASGVVVTDMAVSVSGFPTELGILIQGSEGQSVKAAAAGSVRYLGESEDGYIIELTHEGGFSSIYQGLSQVGVTAGQELRLGEVIGSTSDGEVLFTLLLNEEEVNPLEYLF